MEVRSNTTAEENSPVESAASRHRRSSSKKPLASPLPADTTSVSQRFIFSPLNISKFDFPSPSLVCLVLIGFGFIHCKQIWNYKFWVELMHEMKFDYGVFIFTLFILNCKLWCGRIYFHSLIHPIQFLCNCRLQKELMALMVCMSLFAVYTQFFI